MKPVASTGTTRTTKRDLNFGDYTIPAGTMCICPFDAIHHNVLNWEDPDTFKPVLLHCTHLYLPSLHHIKKAGVVDEEMFVR